VARYNFGGGVSDWVFSTITVSGTADLAQVTGSASVTFWSAESAGAQFGDLLGPDGSPTAAITSSSGTDGRAKGQIPPFKGPDGVRLMWAQAGSGPRALIKTTDDLREETILPPMSVPGTITSPMTGGGRIYNDTSATLQVLSVRASVATVPTTAVTVDINRNGSSIFSTPSNRPVVAIGANTSGQVIPLDQVTLAPGDYVTADVDTGAGAAGLVVQLVVSRADA
jgi:hypothetical protein